MNILLLDVFNIYYRVAKVKSQDVVKNTMNLITKSAKEAGLKWDAVYCCFDSHTYHRKLIYSDYKANRGHSEKLNGDALVLFNMLKNLGFTVLQFEGFEADDIIAQLCNQFKDDKKVIISTDEDLYQLLDANTVIYKNRNTAPVTEQSFKDTYGIEPKDWSIVKAIAGCDSDNVPGIDGIGEKTALAYVRGEKKSGCKITEHHAMIQRNLKLVQLPLSNHKLPSIDHTPFVFNTSYLMFTDFPVSLYESVWSQKQSSLFSVFDF